VDIPCWAVYWPRRLRPRGRLRLRELSNLRPLIFPAAFAPTASKTSWMVTSFLEKFPRRLSRRNTQFPEYSAEPAPSPQPDRFVTAHYGDYRVEKLASADEFDGVGDQFAADQRRAPCLRAHVSPSEIAMVLNSMGVPPAARIPSFTLPTNGANESCRAWFRSRCWPRPIRGWRKSWSVNPKHRSRLNHGGARPRARRAMFKAIWIHRPGLAPTPDRRGQHLGSKPMPCNFHLRRLSAKVKGRYPRCWPARPLEFNTIAIFRRRNMGTKAMRASLVSAN